VKKSRINNQHKISNKKKSFYEDPLFLILVVFALTFIAFLPSLENNFLNNWDDNKFITDNVIIRQLNFQSIKSIFSSSIESAYVPLPILSFAVEYHFFGSHPLIYHVSNLILYLACIFLVFHFFRLLRLDTVYAALGALLFGIHPMHVESVAWITERKDLLYGLFYMASLIMYMKYIRSHDQGMKFFVISMLFFVLALFSKIQAVTLPISLILIDYFTERPFTSKLLFEKVPSIVLSLIVGLAGIIILTAHGTLEDIVLSKLSERIFFGLYALSMYIGKFIAPVYLSAAYPYPQNLVHAVPASYYLIPSFLVVLGFFIYKSVRFTRAIVFGTLFFLFNIIFLLQIVAAGNTYLSDRYSFIPYVGFCFIAGWSMENIMKKKKGLKYISVIAFSLTIIVFVLLTFDRCKTWKDDETLWTDAIEKYPNDNASAYYNRGFGSWQQGQWQKALADYSKAIEINSEWALAYNSRGIVYENIGQWEKAIADYSKAIENDPKYGYAYNNRGIVYCKLGQWDKAIVDCSKAIEIDPKCVLAYSNRGIAYRNLGQWDKAVADCSRAVEIDPQCALAYNNRGNVYGKLGQWDKALTDYSHAIKIDPTSALAYSNRGRAYSNLGQWEQAIADYSKLIEINPNSAVAYNNRGNAYVKLGHWEQAKADYSKADEINSPSKK
jgi:tetratricopeptide (TPR) repeat protein